MAQKPPEEHIQTPETNQSSTQHPSLLKSSNRSLISITAAILLGSFFLPWTHAMGDVTSGWDMQRDFESRALLFLPLCALIVLILNIAGRETPLLRRSTGLIPLIILVVGLSKFQNHLWHMIAWGGWTALLSGIALVMLPDPPFSRPMRSKSAFSQNEKGEVLSHWYTLIPNFKTSTNEFYAFIEAELKYRQVPGLDIGRVEFAEGGILSDKRTYLRMIRERLVFDVCSAPFGTSHFFSCRFAEIPPVIRIWQLLTVFIGLCATLAFAWKAFGFLRGSLILFFGLAFLIFLLRNAVAMGLRNVDAAIIRSPVVGPLYERFLRKDTYYREDTRLMYCDTIEDVVKAKVEDVTGAQGIKLVRFNEYDPIWRDLYKPRLVTLDEEPAVKAA